MSATKQVTIWCDSIVARSRIVQAEAGQVKRRVTGRQCTEWEQYDEPTITEARRKAKREGWTRTRDGSDRCPLCTADTRQEIPA